MPILWLHSYRHGLLCNRINQSTWIGLFLNNRRFRLDENIRIDPFLCQSPTDTREGCPSLENG